jgi:hypothetical protein
MAEKYMAELIFLEQSTFLLQQIILELYKN